jgi:hypothetical protein
MSDAFPYFVNVRHEALQLLHHAYCYDFRYVLIVFCNSNGGIIGGVWVHFSVELKQHWGNVLVDMHMLSLAYAYRPPDQPVVQSQKEYDELELVVKTVVVAGAPLDMHSFLQWLALWRIVQLTWLPPLPPIARIIPRNLSNWNAVKGGSDTITKLLWTVMNHPPNDHPQSAVVSRILLLAFISIHRLNHIATAKAGDAKINYKSLRHFRHASNQRSSLYGTLLAITKCSAFALPDTRPAGFNRSGHKCRAVSSPSARQVGAGAEISSGVTLAAVPVTGSTPKRVVMHQYQCFSQQDSATLSPNTHEVLERRICCPGNMIRSVGKNAIRGNCIVCQQDCYSYCLLCHTYCHDTKLYPGAEEDTFPIHVPNFNGKGKAKTFNVMNSCYWYLHKEAFKNTYGQE